jgi:hypothetical protein
MKGLVLLFLTLFVCLSLAQVDRERVESMNDALRVGQCIGVSNNFRNAKFYLFNKCMCPLAVQTRTRTSRNQAESYVSYSLNYVDPAPFARPNSVGDDPDFDEQQMDNELPPIEWPSPAPNVITSYRFSALSTLSVDAVSLIGDNGAEQCLASLSPLLDTCIVVSPAPMIGGLRLFNRCPIDVEVEYACYVDSLDAAIDGQSWTRSVLVPAFLGGAMPTNSAVAKCLSRSPMAVGNLVGFRARQSAADLAAAPPERAAARLSKLDTVDLCLTTFSHVSPGGANATILVNRCLCPLAVQALAPPNIDAPIGLTLSTWNGVLPSPSPSSPTPHVRGTHALPTLNRFKRWDGPGMTWTGASPFGRYSDANCALTRLIECVRVVGACRQCEDDNDDFSVQLFANVCDFDVRVLYGDTGKGSLHSMALPAWDGQPAPRANNVQPVDDVVTNAVVLTAVRAAAAADASNANGIGGAEPSQQKPGTLMPLADKCVAVIRGDRITNRCNVKLSVQLWLLARDSDSTSEGQFQTVNLAPWTGSEDMDAVLSTVAPSVVYRRHNDWDDESPDVIRLLGARQLSPPANGDIVGTLSPCLVLPSEWHITLAANRCPFSVRALVYTTLRGDGAAPEMTTVVFEPLRVHNSTDAYPASRDIYARLDPNEFSLISVL